MSEDISELVTSLNSLLEAIDIPVEIETPTDLTPTLLLAILESTLQSRLPLKPNVRNAATPQAKVEAVKILLGVLGGDVLGVDLSDIDPRRLARGEWDEVVYVGGLLIHVARQEGLLPEDVIIDIDPDISFSDAFNNLTPSQETVSPRQLSPSISNTTPKRSPQPRSVSQSTTTSTSTLPSVKKDTAKRLPTHPRKPSFMTFRPPPVSQATKQRIPEPSICSCTDHSRVVSGSSAAYCDCTRPVPRMDGWLTREEPDFEKIKPRKSPLSTKVRPQPPTLDHRRIYDLLTQKARLLDELSNLSLEDR